MTAPTGQLYPVGARYVALYEYAAGGFLAATDENPYEGSQIVGMQTFNVTLPDYRRISHQGDDRVLQVDFLPPTEQATAEINVSEENLANLAIMTSTLVRTIGEAKLLGLATSEQGNEPDLGLLMYQQAVSGTGTRVWRSFMIPRGRLSPRPSGFNENPSQHNIQVAMNVSSAHLWGETFVQGTDGFEEAQVLIMHTQYKPNICAFIGDNSTTAFSLPTAKPAVSTDKIHGVWVDGVKKTLTTHYTVTTTAITFLTAPADGATIVVLYEFN